MSLSKKLKALGDLNGQTYRQIVQACGPETDSRSVRFDDIGPGTERTWGGFMSRVTLKFNSQGKCCGVVKKRYPVLYAVAALVVVVGILFLVDFLTGNHTCNLCGEPAINRLYRDWYCDTCYQDMLNYMAPLGIM